MRFVTFSRKNQQRLGLMGPQEQIIDLAEVNRRYLKGWQCAFSRQHAGIYRSRRQSGASRA